MLILIGAIVGVSGLVGVFLLAAYFILLPVALVGAGWLIFDSWTGESFSDALVRSSVLIKAYWVMGMIGLPVTIWQLNQSWFFMVRNFSVDENPGDTAYPELFATGMIEVTDSTYFGAVTFSEQGLVLDRRNFSPVVLPWKWVLSVDPVSDAQTSRPRAQVQMRNNEDEFVTLTIPWNAELLRLNTARLKRDQA